MRFIVKQTGSGSERIGHLTDFLKSPGAILETPTTALFTQIPGHKNPKKKKKNLTADVLSWVFSSPQLLWVPLSNSIHLENGVKLQNDGVAKFAGLSKHATCVALNNFSEETPSGHFEPNKVPLWTKNGKKMISSNRYMDVMEVFKPDIILAIADGRTSLAGGNKRVSKALDRTNQMLKECVNRYKASKDLQNSMLVGVIIGAPDSRKFDESIQNILSHADTLSGIALEGITDGTVESMEVDTEKLNEVFEKISNKLPKDFVRIIEGCWNPAVILSAIEHGWDIFDGSYPVKLTNAGVALKINFDVTKENDTMYLLDMIDEKYKEDFTPILEGCECLACKKHTRAYIRHLLNTREMLASVLLSIHNLHHFDQMFCHARRHIASKTFATFKEHITKQFEMLKTFAPDRNKGLNASIDKPTLQKNKKIRVSDDVSSHIECNNSI